MGIQNRFVSSTSWCKLSTRTKEGAPGSLYVRLQKRDVSGHAPASSLLATLGVLDATVSAPLQAVPEAQHIGGCRF